MEKVVEKPQEKIEKTGQKVDVVISGEIITLKSTEEPDYIQRLARYADEKITEVVAKSKVAALNEKMRSLLIALNIADDYHKSLDKFMRLDSLHKRFVREMSKLQEENTKISTEMSIIKTELTSTKTQLASTQKELEETKAELALFMESFNAENPPEGENILSMPKLPNAKRKSG
jgi:cell division protein ZapA (FtsZ GTPase activity inhibitor)